MDSKQQPPTFTNIQAQDPSPSYSAQEQKFAPPTGPPPPQGGDYSSAPPPQQVYSAAPMAAAAPLPPQVYMAAPPQVVMAGAPNVVYVQQQPLLTMANPAFFPEFPVQLACPTCKATVQTVTEKKTGAFTWLACCFLGLVKIEEEERHSGKLISTSLTPPPPLSFLIRSFGQ